MLEIQGLSKSYGNNVAVDNVDFTVPDGQVGILLGHGAALLVERYLGWPIASSPEAVLAAA